MSQKKKVAIIGGGVSGLLSALEFQKRDWKIDVYDPDLLTGNSGFGFLLMPNGVSGLKKLGYWNPIEVACTPIKKVNILDDDNNALNVQQVDNIYGISRHHFLEALSADLGSNVHRIPQKIVLQSDQSLYLNDTLWDHEGYQWIVGCDGIHSQVRKKLFPDAEMIDAPTYEINGSYMDLAFTQEHAGNLYKIIFDTMGIALGILPLHTGQVIWFLQLSKKHFGTPEEKNLSLADFVKHTVQHFHHPWILNIVENHLEGLYLWKGKILLGVDQYIQDKYILLGDAAHVVLPFTSQGTNLAIDDIVSLTETMDKLDSKDEIAIRHFNNRREACERIAFEGMEYAHLFSNNDSKFMINHMPLVFDQL